MSTGTLGGWEISEDLGSFEVFIQLLLWRVSSISASLCIIATRDALAVPFSVGQFNHPK